MSVDPEAAGGPVIRYRPGVPKPERRKPVPRHSSGPRKDDRRIIVDMPGHPPVTSAEIAVIETFLGDRIDALLARCASKA